MEDDNPSLPHSEPNWVVRAGFVSPEQLQNGSREHPAVPGLFGFSVQYDPGRTVRELASAGQFPHARIGVAIAEDVFAAAEDVGYNVALVKSPGHGFHFTIQVPEPFPPVLAMALSGSFSQFANPERVIGRRR